MNNNFEHDITDMVTHAVTSLDHWYGVQSEDEEFGAELLDIADERLGHALELAHQSQELSIYLYVGHTALSTFLFKSHAYTASVTPGKDRDIHRASSRVALTYAHDHVVNPEYHRLPRLYVGDYRSIHSELLATTLAQGGRLEIVSTLPDQVSKG